MKKVIVSILTILPMLNWAQDKSQADSSNWEIKMVGSINGSQAAFSNWAAGGQNTIAITGLYDLEAIYKKDKLTWKSGANLAYGISKIAKDKWRKSDDNFELYTGLGYDIHDAKVDIAWLNTFKTQFGNGYNLPNDSIKVSKFMAPGYVTTALGIDYHPVKNLQILVSPLTAKFTFVRDTDLANAGAFGVTGAEYDNAGNLLTAGKMFRAELGAFIKILYSRELITNITMKTKLELFSNYLNKPQNIDVNAELLLNFKINKWFQANLALNMIYDDDIDITTFNDDGTVKGVGPRLQFKEVLSLGVSYTFHNKAEK